MLLVSAAWAASVAVMELDGLGARHADTAALAEALRAAFVDERLLDPLAPADVSAGLLAGHDVEVRRARDLMAEARRNRLAVNHAGCATAAEEAAELLVTAGFRYARRADLADAWFLQARCLASSGRTTDAWFVLDGVVRVYPDYADSRAMDIPPDVALVMMEARKRTASARPTPPPEESMAGAVDRLGVDFVVAGGASAAGEVTLWIFDGAGQRGDAVERAISWPARDGDAGVAELARALAARVGLAPIEVRREAPPEEDPEPQALAPEVREPRALSEEPEADARLVTRRWWFWSGLVLLTGGGTTAILLALPEEAPEDSTGAPSWSVHVPLD